MFVTILRSSDPSLPAEAAGPFAIAEAARDFGDAVVRSPAGAESYEVLPLVPVE